MLRSCCFEPFHTFLVFLFAVHSNVYGTIARSNDQASMNVIGIYSTLLPHGLESNDLKSRTIFSMVPMSVAAVVIDVQEVD